MNNENKRIENQLKELIELSTSIQNLLILNISKTDIPHEKIAKSAHMRKEKLYDYIPRKKKTSNNEDKKDG